MLAKIKKGPIYVYDTGDMKTDTRSSVITGLGLGVNELTDVMCVPSVGQKVVLSGRKSVGNLGRERDETVAFIWDINKGKVVL